MKHFLFLTAIAALLTSAGCDRRQGELPLEKEEEFQGRDIHDQEYESVPVTIDEEVQLDRIPDADPPVRYEDD